MAKRRHSFLIGVGSLFEIFNTRPVRARRAETDFEAFSRDGEALASDWVMVGRDLRHAMDRVREEKTLVSAEQPAAR